MLGQQQNSTPDFRPSSGRIVYTRWMGANYIISGNVIGEREVVVRRHNAVVTEYLVVTDPEVTNLSRHIVDESNVIEIKPPCPDCGGHGYLSIVGDQDTPCPVCNPVADEVAF